MGGVTVRPVRREERRPARPLGEEETAFYSVYEVGTAHTVKKIYFNLWITSALYRDFVT